MVSTRDHVRPTLDRRATALIHQKHAPHEATLRFLTIFSLLLESVVLKHQTPYVRDTPRGATASEDEVKHQTVQPSSCRKKGEERGEWGEEVADPSDGSSDGVGSSDSRGRYGGGERGAGKEAGGIAAVEASDCAHAATRITLPVPVDPPSRHSLRACPLTWRGCTWSRSRTTA